MMIPNMVRHPIILLPIFSNALITGFVGALIGLVEQKNQQVLESLGLLGQLVHLDLWNIQYY